MHKSYHAVLGALRGSATAALTGAHGDEIGRAALGGGIGGVTAEILADATPTADNFKLSVSYGTIRVNSIKGYIKDREAAFFGVRV